MESNPEVYRECPSNIHQKANPYMRKSQRRGWKPSLETGSQGVQHSCRTALVPTSCVKVGAPTPSSRNTGLPWWAAWPLTGGGFLEEGTRKLGLDGERYLHNLRRVKHNLVFFRTTAISPSQEISIDRRNSH